MTKAIVFDAYGTLFDVRSVLGRCEEMFPGHGSDLTGLWRTKQLEYTWLRSLMGRYEDFWQVTQDGLVFACRFLGLAPSQDQIDHLMQAYLTLSPFPGNSRRPGSSVEGAMFDPLQWLAQNAGRRGPKCRSDVAIRAHPQCGQSSHLQATPDRLPVGRNPLRHPSPGDRLRLLELLGRGWLESVRVQVVLAQPAKCPAGNAGLSARWGRSHGNGTGGNVGGNAVG